jgi:hypothetical protein
MRRLVCNPEQPRCFGSGNNSQARRRRHKFDAHPINVVQRKRSIFGSKWHNPRRRLRMRKAKCSRPEHDAGPADGQIPPSPKIPPASAECRRASDPFVEKWCSWLGVNQFLRADLQPNGSIKSSVSKANPRIAMRDHPLDRCQSKRLAECFSFSRSFAEMNATILVKACFALVRTDYRTWTMG